MGKNDICSNLLSQWVRHMGYPDPIIIIFEVNVYCFFLSSDETNNGIRPLLKDMFAMFPIFNILLRATSPGLPSYGGVRTWVEGSKRRGNRALARVSNLLGYKEYTQQDFLTYDRLTQALVIHRYDTNSN